jgi:manganese/zinc/iron transport system permease protein
VLPGLAAGFLLTGSRTSIVMFIGAAIVGVLTAVFTQWVHSFGRVDRGASMGVVFTTLFAIGLIMIVRAADHVDLDPGCVLYGSIEMAPLDLVRVGSAAIPRAALVLGGVLLLNTTVVLLFYKELRISAFDPALATTLGINATAMHYLLMTLVAITTVASFEAIGSILVIAMLIVPAAAAHLATERLGSMILVSLVLGALSAALGHVAAITLPGLVGFTDTTTSGMMATAAGGLFVIVLVAAPRHGLLGRAAHRLGLRLRIVTEDALGLLYRTEEQAGPDTAVDLPALLGRVLDVGPIVSRLSLERLARTGRVHREHGRYTLTPMGRREAANLLRTHRLWETYLHENVAVAADHVHGTAERVEHVTDARLRAELARATRSPELDPHGKPVPPEHDSKEG